MAVKKRTTTKTAKKSVSKSAPATRKRVTQNRVATKKSVVAKKTSSTEKLRAIPTKQTKTQILQAVAEDTELSRKQVAAVFQSLGNLIQRNMQKRGSGEFIIPDTGVKIRRVKKPARKARMGRNPSTGEAIKIAAKPATTVVKVTALKALKDTIG